MAILVPENPKDEGALYKITMVGEIPTFADNGMELHKMVLDCLRRGFCPTIEVQREFINL